MTKKLTNRQLNALETKDAIYRAAISLFKSKGFENVLIEDITNAANTAKGTFYSHFKSKKDLLYHTFNKFDEIYAEAFEKVKDIPAFEDRLLSFIEQSYEVIASRGKEIPKALYYNNMLESNPPILRSDRKLYRILLSMVEFGLENGELSRAKPAAYYLEMIITQIVGMDYRWCVATQEMDLAKYTGECMAVCVKGLKSI